MGDILFGITEWLRGTFLLDFAFWLSETSLSLLMVENFWFVPTAQVIHIISIAAAFGASLMLTLRVNNLAGAGQSLERTRQRFAPWIWWGLVGIACSGVLMATAEPIRNMVNSIFWIKMILLLVTIAISLVFQRRIKASAAGAGAEWQAGSGLRTTSILLVILWCLIMACGRWIAYVPV